MTKAELRALCRAAAAYLESDNGPLARLYASKALGLPPKWDWEVTLRALRDGAVAINNFDANARHVVTLYRRLRRAGEEGGRGVANEHS